MRQSRERHHLDIYWNFNVFVSVVGWTGTCCMCGEDGICTLQINDVQ